MINGYSFFNKDTLCDNHLWIFLCFIYVYYLEFHEIKVPWTFMKVHTLVVKTASMGARWEYIHKCSKGELGNFSSVPTHMLKKMKFSQTFKWFTEIWPESAFHASSGLAPPKLHSHWKPQLLNYTSISTIFLIHIINSSIGKSTTDKRTINSSLMGLLHYHSQITNDNNMQAISSSFFQYKKK